MKTSRSIGGVVVTALISALTSAASPAFADEAADTATARAIGIEGVLLADAGKCDAAIEKLTRAEQLHHAPTTATRLGECEIESGQLVRGTERLQRVIREPLPLNAHPAFVAAVGRAHRSLDAALPRVPTLRLSVAAPPDARLEITIDGEVVSEAIVGTNRRIDPGSHAIVVRAAGFFPEATTQSFIDAEAKSVHVAMRRDPAARALAARAAVASGAVSNGTTTSTKLPAIIAFGLGAVGLGVGVYAATVVDEKASLLAGRCDASRVCPPELRGDIRSAKTWATVSTAGFIGAGAGIGTGLVLLLLSGGKTSSPRREKAAVQLRPTVGLGAVGLDGAF